MPTDENRRTNRETLILAATYTEFNNAISAFANYMPENSVRLQVSEDQVTALNSALVSWIAAYNAYANPDTRNRAAILQIENEYKADSEMLRELQQQIKNNAQVTLTGDDRMALGIHQDKETRTRVPVQTVAPSVEVYENKHLENKVRTNYPDSGGDAHRRLPAYNQILYQVAYAPPGSPPPGG